MSQECPFVVTGREGTSHCSLAEADARDAARYRWLREGAQVTWAHGDGIALVVPTRGGLETVDADIDAAMSEASA